jgi:hypothetical protein
MSLTSTFDVPVGTVTISINTTTTEVMNVESVSNIKYEYDVGTGQATVDRLFAIYSTVDIQLLQYSTTGTNLFEYLITEAATPRTVDMTILTHTGLTYRFRFSLDQDSIKYKASTKKVTILCSPIQPTDTVEVVFNSAPSDEYFPVTFDTGLTIGASGIGALNFVKYTLEKINPNLPSVYASFPALGTDLSPNGYEYLASPSLLPTIDLTYGIVYKQIGGDTLSGIAIETLKRMAAIEGGIIGTGFDFNFYIQRLNTTYNTSLNDYEVEEVSFEYGYKPYASIGVSTLSGIHSNLETAPVLESYDNQALKRMDIQFPIPYLYKAEYETGLFGDGFFPNLVTIPDYEASLANNGVTSYVAAFGADKRLVVDVTVLGFDKIKPYQMVVFNTGAEFPTPLNGKYFRPTSLDYDLYQNKVKAKLYYVGDV